MGSGGSNFCYLRSSLLFFRKEARNMGKKTAVQLKVEELEGRMVPSAFPPAIQLGGEIAAAVYSPAFPDHSMIILYSDAGYLRSVSVKEYGFMSELAESGGIALPDPVAPKIVTGLMDRESGNLGPIFFTEYDNNGAANNKFPRASGFAKCLF